MTVAHQDDASVSAKFGISGRYMLKAVNAGTGESRDLTDWFDNLITDIGMNRLGTGAAIAYCHVGSGSVAPSFTDTALASFVAATGTINASINGASATAPYYGWTRITFRFAQGAAAGNLSEVGVGWTLASGSLFSRSLIKDSGGIPTTVTVLADEFLDVIYEFRVYAPAADVSSTFDVSGTSYGYTIRAAYVTSGNVYWNANNAINAGSGVRPCNLSYVLPQAYGAGGALGALTAGPSGVTNGTFSGSAVDAYSSGSYTRTGRIIAALNDCNAASGITAIMVNTDIGCYQIAFTAPIPKDSTKVFTLNLSVSWARA